jgi:hypothetical protein
MSEWYKDVKIGNVYFRVKKADDKKHKYISWHMSKIDNQNVLLSAPIKWGAYGMEQYKDKFKQYADLNHNDKKRQDAFKKRFNKLYEKNKENPKSAIYWSWTYLW